jgi:CheY-like chemotaxis protein
MNSHTNVPEKIAADLPEALRRLQDLVCYLLAKNEQLRGELQREQVKSMRNSTDYLEARQQEVKQVARIFVVDDEPLIAVTLAQLLLEQGYCALWFSDPLDAIAAVALHAPDLLISDITMPQLCGIDLALHVKRTQPHCSILLVSARVPDEDLLALAREQGHTFRLLGKPIDVSHFLAEVRCLLPDRC